jgi:hypothetical protein
MAEKETKTINEKLKGIQSELNAPKNQFNKFGGYAYRSCEDIYNAVKPLLAKYNCTLVLTDEVVMVGERYYVKATATLSDFNNFNNSITNTAYAREEETKKGMDGSQITGASSSYARKYALNGLFLIDDVRDSDVTNTHGKEAPKGEYTNPEIAKKTFVSFADDWLFRHPEMEERIFTKYNIKDASGLVRLPLEQVDEMLTGMKKVDEKAREATSIYGKEETF